MTETYTAVTPDNEVASIDQVQVRRVMEAQKDWGVERSSDIITLSHVNTRLAVLKGQIAAMGAEAEELLATKAHVEEAAVKVVLKSVKSVESTSG